MKFAIISVLLSENVNKRLCSKEKAFASFLVVLKESAARINYSSNLNDIATRKLFITVIMVSAANLL